jgi:hypothetical protein
MSIQIPDKLHANTRPLFSGMTVKIFRHSWQARAQDSSAQESLPYPYLMRLPLLDAENLLPEREVSIPPPGW